MLLLADLLLVSCVLGALLPQSVHEKARTLDSKQRFQQNDHVSACKLDMYGYCDHVTIEEVGDGIIECTGWCEVRRDYFHLFYSEA